MFSKALYPVYSNFSSAILKTSSQQLHFQSVRYAARKGTRAAANAAKKALKLQQANKPQAIPKYLQRKIKVSAELERRRCSDENWLEAQPIDDVFNMKLYRGKPYSVSESVEMLRQTHAPEMLNDSSALLYVNIEMDLRLKKKDRYMEDLTGIVRFPHEFDTNRKNKIVVVCKNADDQVKATDAGAVYAGSTALIKQILSGSVSKDDFDYLICHPDMYKELNAVRGILGKKYPNTHNGLLRIDIEPAVRSFIVGIEYNLKRSALEPDFGWVDVCFGRLDMPLEILEENLKCALECIEKHKPNNTAHILFVIRTLLFCEKSRERFKVPHWEYLSDYPKNGVRVEAEEDEEELSAEPQAEQST